MLFTMNVTAFAAETQENYSETEKTMTFEITPTALTSGSSRHSVGMLNSFFGRACGHFFRPLCLYSFYNLED